MQLSQSYDSENVNSIGAKTGGQWEYVPNNLIWGTQKMSAIIYHVILVQIKYSTILQENGQFLTYIFQIFRGDTSGPLLREGRHPPASSSMVFGCARRSRMFNTSRRPKKQHT